MNHRERMRNRARAELRGAELQRETSRPSIELKIDELVLSGMHVRDRYRVANAVQGELIRILAEQGLPAPLHDSRVHDRLNGGEISTEQITRDETIGNQIAQAMYSGFSQPESNAVPSGFAHTTYPGNLPKL